MLKFWRSSTARFITLVFGIELILAAGMTLTLQVLTRAELERDAKSYAAQLTQELGPVYLKQGKEDFQKLAALRILFSEGRAAVILMVDPKGQPVAGNLQGWPPAPSRDGAKYSSTAVVPGRPNRWAFSSPTCPMDRAC